jgi:predicted TIM-barrel fold metal-dependent hydrolase
MANNGIQKAILSLTAPGAAIAPDAASARTLARQVNEEAARLRKQYPKSFGFFAALPSLTDIPGSLAEIAYALDILKADGVTLFTRYGDGNDYLGHPHFTPIWEELNARKAIVFIHPTHPANTTWTNPLLPQPVIDYPHETTRTAVDLIIANVTQKFPDCPKILSHAGGSLPYLISRIATTSRETEDTKLMYGKTSTELFEDFRSFYFDLALSSSPAVLNMLLDLVPHNQIIYGLALLFLSYPWCTCAHFYSHHTNTYIPGSDFPYADSDKIAGFRENLDAFRMGDKLRKMIYQGNANDLLRK